MMSSLNSNYRFLSELQRLSNYSRMKPDGKKETWNDTCDRSIYSLDSGLIQVGKLTAEEAQLIDEMMRGGGDPSKTIVPPSGRWMFCGGTPWLNNPENWHGAFNCTSRDIEDPADFGIAMGLSMMGCGFGATLEPKYTNKLPKIKNTLSIEVVGSPGDAPIENRIENTVVESDGRGQAQIVVGDSRRGWVDSYQAIVNLAFFDRCSGNISVTVDISNIRRKGEKLKGFGGTADPSKLAAMYLRLAVVINPAIGRQLTPLECCLLIDEPAEVIRAGGVRRSAGMRQFASQDTEAAMSKHNLWVKLDGKWRIDPQREALQNANHTMVYHQKPSYADILKSVNLQYQSGEGAIEWAGEAVARGNADLINTEERRKHFCECYNNSIDEAADFLASLYLFDAGEIIDADKLKRRLERYKFNPCGEAIFSNNHCNLITVHLENLDPLDFTGQEKAFRSSGLQAASLLQRGFTDPKFQQSRDEDPIVIASCTEMFSFFARALGMDWLRWWQAGRPDNWNSPSGLISEELQNHPVIVEQRAELLGIEYCSDYLRCIERGYLNTWRDIIHRTVWEYCDRHNLARPNRCTGLKPEGSTTLLTGAGCCGVHPPKAFRFIRRKSCQKNDPIALAAIDYGYSVVPGRNDKDEQGNLLDDITSERCTEWVIEVPYEESLIRYLPEIDQEGIDPSSFSAESQFDWIMTVQRNFVTHNTSATLELRESEISKVAQLIYRAIQQDMGYISITLLARFDDRETFPRLPFEPISKEKYDQLQVEILARRKSDCFQTSVEYHLQGVENNVGDAACEGILCELKH
ncbi:MAG: ribonucleoside-triphosphate reductase, adenosylcobalamin-dependent [Crinalium sp.]